MYDLFWSRVVRSVFSAGFALSVAVLLGACSSGITLFNNSSPNPYGHANGGGMGAVPASLPMPPQPFTGNQLAAARVAAAQRPIYVYQPTPPPYRNPGYRSVQYAARPQYVVQPGPAVPTRAMSVRNANIRRNVEGKVIIVRWGDTLYGIARANGVNIRDLQAANNIRGSHVKVGRKLFIPGIGSHHPLPAAQQSGPRRGVTVARYQGTNLR